MDFTPLPSAPSAPAAPVAPVAPVEPLAPVIQTGVDSSVVPSVYVTTVFDQIYLPFSQPGLVVDHDPPAREVELVDL